MSAALLLLPDFALILLGWGLRRGMHLGDHFWTGLERLVYFVLFPALLFNAIARTPLDVGAAAPLLLAALAGTLAGMLLALPAGRLFGMARGTFAAQYQCAFRFNTYVGIAVAGKLHGAAGIAAMGLVAGAMVPPVNLAAVWMLARQGQRGVWRELARNPLILATVAGLAFSASGLPYPELARQFLGRLAEASIALGLLAVGAALKLRGAGGAHRGAIYLGVVKLAAVPAVTYACGRALGLTGVYFDVVVAFAALPAASSAYILAMRMGGDGPAVAWLISATTLAAMLTLPLWLTAL